MGAFAESIYASFGKYVDRANWIEERPDWINIKAIPPQSSVEFRG